MEHTMNLSVPKGRRVDEYTDSLYLISMEIFLLIETLNSAPQGPITH